ncbi:lysoplasmalogenase family protein [Kurthia senegalensis]|uniref:lysoplasmalogenase family protein n=1 Tax=Kurthia senegalensis TaxID=1033740 RepID=UPI0002883E72|nr:lysoplasmalogenase family protein [Kurthia senegalensis]
MILSLIGSCLFAVYSIYFLPDDLAPVAQQLFKTIPILLLILFVQKTYEQTKQQKMYFILCALIFLAIATATFSHFILSMALFIIAQYFFIRAFLTFQLKKPNTVFLIIIVIGAAISIGWIVGNILKAQLYTLGFLISSYFVLTLTLLWLSLFTRNFLIISATICFICANLFFAIDHFITEVPTLSLWMLPPYYVSCILFSLVGTKYFGLPNKVIE